MFTPLLLAEEATTKQTAEMFAWPSIEQAFTNAYTQVISVGPRVAGALVVLILGFIVSKLAARLMAAICQRIGLQTAADKSGLAESLQQAGVKRSVPQIMGTIVFWLLMSLFLLAICNILQLEGVTAAMQKVVDYIPRLLVAIVLVVIGLLMATFLKGLISASADRIGITYAQQLGSAIYYMLVVLVLITAFEHLEIKVAILNSAILILLGAVALGFGLSFGLGGRDVMGGILAGYYVRQRMQAGDRVSVAGLEGIVHEIGPVSTIIETDEDGEMRHHSIPNVKMLNEAVR